MTPDEQLSLWLDGKPIHNGTRPDGECCPDFSCCRPDLLAPRATREAFVNASTAEREAMLFGFLGAAFADRKVYIAGGPVEEDS